MVDSLSCAFLSSSLALSAQLDMEAVLWLEDYLGSWNKILFFVCHSQDFMNVRPLVMAIVVVFHGWLMSLFGCCTECLHAHCEAGSNVQKTALLLE